MTTSIGRRVFVFAFLIVLSSLAHAASNWTKNPDGSLTFTANESSTGRIFPAGCSKKSLRVRATDKSFPFYVAVTCQNKRAKVYLNVNVPQEVSIGSSTLREVRSRKPQWRTFEIPASSDSESGANSALSLGTMEFIKDGVSYQFEVQRTTQVQTQSKGGRRGMVDVGLGYASLSVSSNVYSGSDGQPLLLVAVPPYRLWKNLGVGADAEMTFALSKSTSTISYMQIQGHGSYRFDVDRKIFFEPRAYFLKTDWKTEGGGGVSMAGMESAVGFLGAYEAMAKNWLQFEAFMLVTGAPIVKSHYSIHISWRRQLLENDFWSYSFGAKMQSYTVEGPSKAQHTFSQTIGYLAVLF